MFCCSLAALLVSYSDDLEGQSSKRLDRLLTEEILYFLPYIVKIIKSSSYEVDGALQHEWEM
jgi:hypothetical protein